MATADNRYSRFVQLAKIAFPLAALALLSTLFLFSRSLDPTRAIPFADVDVEKIAREQRLASPKFSGVTSDGSKVTMRAASATPDPDDGRRLTAENVEANIDTPNGIIYDIESVSAVYDGSDESLLLEGNVVITTSSGYRLETDKLRTNIKETALEIPVEVRGYGPETEIRADRLDLVTQGASQVLVFKGGVKLVYNPKE